MAAAVAWGALAAGSLVLGAALAMLRRWPDRVVGLVLAFGAGALISAVSFELAEEGVRIGGGVAVGIGLAAGALTYFAVDRVLEPVHPARFRGDAAPASGVGLALGAFLDGIPEQLVLGIGLAAGGGVSVSLVVAIFVSNLPEAIGSSTEMLASGRSRGAVMRIWVGVAVVCVVATMLGYALADAVGNELKAAIDGFAAGALLVMLIDAMVPEATRKAGREAGLLTVLGFALAAALSFGS